MLEQLLAVGPHPLEITHAQVVVLGAGPADAADDRWPSGWASERPSTMAAAPEPRVRVANCDLMSAAVAAGSFSRSRVTSCVCRHPSELTIRA